MRRGNHGLGMALLVLLVGGSSGCGDDDNTNDNNQNSVVATCGNGVVEPGEECDDGEDNSDLAADACRSTCRSAFCGDGVVDTGETCDEGAANSDRIPGACRRDCAEPACGDGVVDPWEDCDDGDVEAGDGCDADCAVEPHWSCSGELSSCECLPYYRTPDCQECVVYVSASADASAADGQSWATAFPRIQDGVDAAWAAGAGCEVWVTEGSYVLYEYSPLNSLQLRDGVGVYGGFVGDEQSRSDRDLANHWSVLDGTGPTMFTSLYHVVTAVDVQDAVIDGFDIMEGDAYGVDAEDRRGGGLMTRGSKLRVANCWFYENDAAQGAAIASNGSQLEISECHFHDNRAQTRGGAIYAQDGQVTVTNCGFTSNSAQEAGGALYSHWSSVTITGSTLVTNLALARGGALAHHLTAVEITHCRFEENRALGQGSELGGGAIYFSQSLSRVDSSLFLRNQALGAADGGALRHEQSSDTLRSCTFVGNVAAGYGGAISSHSATALQGVSPEITNCILWGNSAGAGGDTLDLYPQPAALPSFRHCDIEGGLPAGSTDLGGNFDADPLFVDPANDDYHLAPSSLCIDAGWGDNETPSTDLDGNPRADAGHATAHGGGGTPNYVDVGAFEYQP